MLALYRNPRTNVQQLSAVGAAVGGALGGAISGEIGGYVGAIMDEELRRRQRGRQ